jgi:chromosomal replication initiation ATPase DnaA
VTSTARGSASKYTFETFVIGSSNDLKVRYASSEEFTKDFINMIRAATTPPSSVPTGRSGR